MTRYAAIKGLRFLFCLGIVVTFQFLIPRLMPGSPVINLTGPDGMGLSEKTYQEMERELGLDLPLQSQFLNHIKELSSMNMGFSWFYHEPVTNVITRHISPTIRIVLPAAVLSAFLSMIFGSLAGRYPGKAVDILITSSFITLYAIPAFLTAMICLALLSFTWSIFPLGGLGGTDMEPGSFSWWADIVNHMTLPVVVLALSTAGPKCLVMRNRVVEESEKDYVVFSRARGMDEYRILFVHILRNACIPVVSLIGLDFGFILSGALLVEIVFSINGMGSLIHEAAMNRDYPVLQGCFLLLSLVVLSVNFLVDIITGILDPGTQA